MPLILPSLSSTTGKTSAKTALPVSVCQISATRT